MRLNGWHQRDPQATPGHPDTGAAALLETAQLHAVETVRRHGCTWVEIATALHVEQGVAEARWRDLSTTPVDQVQ